MWLGQGVAGLLVLGVLVFAPAAHAQVIGDWRAQVYDASGETDEDVFDQAGGHPFIGVTDFTLSGTQTARNIRVDVPPGLVPNPDLAPRCSTAELEASDCPTSSQIGTEELTIRLLLLDARVPQAEARGRRAAIAQGGSAVNCTPCSRRPGDSASTVPSTS